MRVVAAYRPNPPGEGNSTAWWQHRMWLLEQGDEREPRRAFMEDLCRALQTWLQDGEHIVVGMDANDDLRSGEVARTLERLGLEERILQRHRDRTPQATYHRNTKGKPIDGIFSSPGVPVLAAGYYDWDEAVTSTHRALWVDVSDNLLGHSPRENPAFPVRRLRTDDPRRVKTYLKHVDRRM